MSQGVWNTINPYTTSGIMLAGILTDFKDAVVSGFSGTTRPPNMDAGGMWIDTTNQGAPNYYMSLKIYTGTTDVEVYRISTLNNIAGTTNAASPFTINRYSGDTTGAILEFIKRRVDSSGQVLSGDTVFEIQISGRTNTGVDTTVAYMRWNATDDMTTSASGGTWSIFSTTDGGASLAEHLRFIEGSVETVVPFKLNALRLVSQNVATAATIPTLSSNKLIAEMTGSTATSIQGIDATGPSDVVIIHNRSSAVITLKNQDGSATSTNRLKLPSGLDHDIPADGTAQLYYCSTDGRWKLKAAGSPLKITRTATELNGLLNNWTAPTSVTRVRVTTYFRRYRSRIITADQSANFFRDGFGNILSYGTNGRGFLGDGSATTRSSPVIATGGFTWKWMASHRSMGSGPAMFGITNQGNAYAWGNNGVGILGVGDASTSRSSPVAVLGRLKFYSIHSIGGTGVAGGLGTGTTFALDENGNAWGWGSGSTGGFGVSGNDYSSPVAVIGGGIKFERIGTWGSGNAGLWGLDNTGALYFFGDNIPGNIAPSSPTLITGLPVIKDIPDVIYGAASSSNRTMYILGNDGSAWGWGLNSNGQVGGGTTNFASSPVQVIGGILFDKLFSCNAVSASNGSAFGLTSDGTLYAWGINASGQLGLGDVIPRSSPVAVLGGLKFKHVSALGASVLAIASDNSLYSWGINTSGQLGLGDTTPRSSPVAVVGGIKAIETYMGPSSAWAADTTGTLYHWGATDGIVAATSIPTLVPGGIGIGSSNLPVFQGYVNVVPGNVYSILLGDRKCLFGGTPIGATADSIVIEYDK